MRRRQAYKVKQQAHTICETCDHAIFIRDTADNVRVYCRYMEKSIHFMVDECSVYDEKHTMSRHDMESMATYIQLKPKIGFVGETEVEFVLPGTEEHKKIKDY